jgi:hypothetical protein
LFILAIAQAKGCPVALVCEMNNSKFKFKSIQLPKRNAEAKDFGI